MKTEWEYEHPLALTDGVTYPLYSISAGPEFIDSAGPLLVFLSVSDGWQDWNDVLTPTQARELAAILLQAADAAERGTA